MSLTHHSSGSAPDVSDDVEGIGLELTDPYGNDDQNPGGTTLGMAGYSVNVDNRVLPYMGLVASASILLLAILVPNEVDHDSMRNHNYGLAVGIVTIVLGVFGLYMTLMNHGLYENEMGTLPLMGTLTWGRGLAYLLLVWTLIGASLLTFQGPFLVTSNGYFASWGLVVASLMALGVTTEVVRTHTSSLGWNNALLVAILIQLCAVIPELSGVATDFNGGSGSNHNHGRCIYSLVLCILTILVVLAFGAYPGIESLRLPVFSFWSVLWLVMACTVTFQGPFRDTGNGYFSAWAGFLLTILTASTSSAAP